MKVEFKKKVSCINGEIVFLVREKSNRCKDFVLRPSLRSHATVFVCKWLLNCFEFWSGHTLMCAQWMKTTKECVISLYKLGQTHMLHSAVSRRQNHFQRLSIEMHRHAVTAGVPPQLYPCIMLNWFWCGCLLRIDPLWCMTWACLCFHETGESVWGPSRVLRRMFDAGQS